MINIRATLPSSLFPLHSSLFTLPSSLFTHPSSLFPLLNITHSPRAKLMHPERQRATRLHTMTFHPNIRSSSSKMDILMRNVAEEDRLYTRYLRAKTARPYRLALSRQMKCHEHRKLVNTAHSNEMSGDTRYSPT